MNTSISISRPTKQYMWKGNWLIFWACPAAWLCYWFIPSEQSEPYVWAICGVAGFIAVRSVLSGYLAFLSDYRLFLKFEISQLASNTAYDSRFATAEEMRDAGCHDGKGRVIGLDMDGNPIFIPHKLRPAFTKIVAGTGGGKTSCFCVASCILSLFSAWH